MTGTQNTTNGNDPAIMDHNNNEEKNMGEIELGQIVMDNVTGFKGMVTAKCKYLHGADQCQVEAVVSKENKPAETEWFVIDRLRPAQ